MPRSKASLIAAVAFVVACTGGSSPSDPGDPNGSDDPGPVTSITVSHAALVLASLGETITLTADATDAAGRVVSEATYEWTTSEPSVIGLAIVGVNSKRANATAVANGTATITVTASGITGSVLLTVDQQVAQIRMSPADPAVEFPGEMIPVHAIPTDARGNEMPNVALTWSSNNPAVATIDGNGLVTGNEFGFAGITATAGPVINQVLFSVLGDRFFLNEHVRLRYDLDLPDDGGGPFPAIVFIHGSGMQTRNTQAHATNPLVPEGMAVLRYDKRGVGESTGAFFNVGPSNSEVALRILASDAAAGVRFLKRFPEIDPDRIGVMGNSQGGWIGPLTASETDDVSFMLMWSGPTVSVGLEIFYSNFAEGTTTPLDDVYAQLPGFSGIDGYDPLPVLESLEIPSIWLFGGMDRSIPTRIDTMNMRQFQAMGLPYEFVFYPFARHDLRDSRTGQFVGLWADFVAWLRKEGFL